MEEAAATSPTSTLPPSTIMSPPQCLCDTLPVGCVASFIRPSTEEVHIHYSGAVTKNQYSGKDKNMGAIRCSPPLIKKGNSLIPPEINLVVKTLYFPQYRLTFPPSPNTMCSNTLGAWYTSLWCTRPTRMTLEGKSVVCLTLNFNAALFNGMK